MKLFELFEDELPSVNQAQSLIPELVSTTQHVYDNWQQNDDGYDEELGEGGVCQDIADAMAYVMDSNGIDSMIVDNGGMGDQHVWIMIKVREGVFSVDIPPSVYETGGGYSWKKIKNVVFTNNDVVFDKVSNNPEEFENFGEY